jgi:hypothetical protein
MTSRINKPSWLCAPLALILLVAPAPVLAAGDDAKNTTLVEELDLRELPTPVPRARSSRGGNRGRRAPVRFNISIGGGIYIGNLWMDYSVESRYLAHRDGLVEDEETRNFYFITQPAGELHAGIELINEHLSIGLLIGLSRVTQRAGATMIAEWDEDTEVELDRQKAALYYPPLFLVGIDAAWVFLPDRLFSPFVGIRFGIGTYWDADYHMIDAWEAWYDGDDADTERGMYFLTRVPVRGGADLGVRLNITSRLGAEIHVPVEALATHGYLRGVITGANARFVLRL